MASGLTQSTLEQTENRAMHSVQCCVVLLNDHELLNERCFNSRSVVTGRRQPWIVRWICLDGIQMQIQSLGILIYLLCYGTTPTPPHPTRPSLQPLVQALWNIEENILNTYSIPAYSWICTKLCVFEVVVTMCFTRFESFFIFLCNFSHFTKRTADKISNLLWNNLFGIQCPCLIQCFNHTEFE